MCAREDHCLPLEVLDMRALSEELRHVMYLVACLLGEAVAGAREDSGADEDRHVREFCDKFLHQGQVLRAVIFGRHMNLKESNIDIAQVIIVALGRVANEQFALRVVVFQSIFQGSAYEATSDNSNVNHCLVIILKCCYNNLITLLIIP